MVRLHIMIPEPLLERLQALVEANPQAIADREAVNLSSTAREALRRGVESLEQEVKPKRRRRA